MVSVDHAGKLFERIEANAPAGRKKRYRNNNTGIPPTYRMMQRALPKYGSQMVLPIEDPEEE